MGGLSGVLTWEDVGRYYKAIIDCEKVSHHEYLSLRVVLIFSVSGAQSYIRERLGENGTRESRECNSCEQGKVRLDLALPRIGHQELVRSRHRIRESPRMPSTEKSHFCSEASEGEMHSWPKQGQRGSQQMWTRGASTLFICRREATLGYRS